MAATLNSKYRNWIVYFVLVPAVLSLMASLMLLWRMLNDRYRRDLDDDLAQAGAALEQALRSEVQRLKTIAALPATLNLVGLAERRYATVQPNASEMIETEWGSAARDHMSVRSVLDNEIGLMFATMVKQDPQIASVLLADQQGATLAASEKLPRYFQDTSPWWPVLNALPQAMTLTEGFSADGQLGLLHTIRTPSRALRAALREEIRFLSVAQAIGTEAWSPKAGTESGLMIVAQDAWLVVGLTNVSAKAGPGLVQTLNKTGATEGWVDGHRYVARALDAGITWARPAWIIGARRESRWPAAIFAPFALAVLVGVNLVIGIYLLARQMGRRLFFNPMVESAEAGLWVLRRVYGGDSRTEQFVRQHPWVHLALNEGSAVHADLEKWLRKVQATAQAEVSELTVAIRHDLELATEFQQAFMNRPHPDIPANHVEGRLRLEFFHAYEPALALGGDFFDIESVGPDCAGVFVGDVMGHGTRSALLTAIIRTLLQKLYREGRNPSHFLRELNRALCDLLKVLPQQFFASASYFTLDTTSRIGTYSLAGHPPPFHVHRAIGRVTRLDKPRPRGAALGVIPDEEFGAESVRLVDGDLFVFYTDGVYEAVDASGEQYGLARFEKALRTHIYASPQDLLAKVVEDIKAFVGHQTLEDDICLVAVHVTSKAKGNGDAG